MKFKAALLYCGGIAFYTIYYLDTGIYKAKLENCSGDEWPPSLVALQRGDQQWSSDCGDLEIVKELAAAIEFRKI